jgi:hypothetical protein
LDEVYTDTNNRKGDGREGSRNCDEYHLSDTKHESCHNFSASLESEVLELLTCESVQRSNREFHIDEHEILTEPIECNTSIDRREERHW